MHLEHRSDATIADTGAMQALTLRRPAAIRWVCPRGPEGYDAAECERLLDYAPDPVLLTAAEAARYLGIPAHRVWKWAQRGRLRKLEHTPVGDPLYALDDLQRLAEGVTG